MSASPLASALALILPWLKTGRSKAAAVLAFCRKQVWQRLRHAPLAIGALWLILALALGNWQPWLSFLPLFMILGLSAASGFFFWRFKKPSWALAYLLSAVCLLAIVWQSQVAESRRQVLQTQLASGSPLIYEVQVERPLGRSAGLQAKQVLASLKTEGFPTQKLVISSATPLLAGARLQLRGKLEALPPPRNPGGFDRRQWLAGQGVYWQMRFPELLEVEPRPRAHQALLASLRQWSVERLQHDLAENAGKEILPALVLGLSGEIDFELKEQFRAAGALHLFAVSGLHVGLVAALFALLLRPLPQRYRWPLLLLFLAMFVLLAGLRPSAVRAWVMVALVLLGLLRGRPQVALNSLGLAAIIELVWRPQHLHDPGFQFSYLVVSALLLIALPVQARLLCLESLSLDPLLPKTEEPLWAKLKRLGKVYGLSLVLISCVSWLAALPITLAQFGLFNPLALVLNVLLVPLATVALCLGLLGMLGSMLWPPLGLPLRVLAQNLSLFMAFLAQEGAQRVPPQWLDRDPLPAAAHSRLSLLALDYGYAVFLEHEGRRVLFDCGHARDWEFQLKPFLRYRGVESLDALILSHADSAHVGGVPALLEEFPVRQLLLPPRDRDSASWEAALEAVQEKGIEQVRLHQGQVASLSPRAQLSVLYPPLKQQAEVARADEEALLLSLQLGEYRWLLGSDLGWIVEAQLAKQSDLLQGFSGTILDSHPRIAGGHSSFWQALSATMKNQPNSQPTTSSKFWHLHSAAEANNPSPAIIESLSTPEHGALILDFNAQGELIQLRGWASGYHPSK